MEQGERRMTKEELEKEAEEYRKEKLKEQKDKFVFELPEVYVADIKQAYLVGAEPREKRIAELEKENAELKDYRLTTLAKQQTKMSKYALNLEHKLGWYDTQLTKAKEIIKTFLGFAEAFGYSPSMDKFISDTEQFLSEVEK